MHEYTIWAYNSFPISGNNGKTINRFPMCLGKVNTTAATVPQGNERSKTFRLTNIEIEAVTEWCASPVVLLAFMSVCGVIRMISVTERVQWTSVSMLSFRNCGQQLSLPHLIFLTNENIHFTLIRIKPTHCERGSEVSPRGHVQMTSAKFLWFLTPSLPLSVVVIFSYTPLYWRRHIWTQPPPHCISILHFACIVKSRNQYQFE